MLALPAMAQEPITPQTTMREIRQNPAVQASGLYTDIHTWERDLAWFKNTHNNETLEGGGGQRLCRQLRGGAEPADTELRVWYPDHL